MTTRISRFTGREILDSRGRPTVEATCLLDDGSSGTASVPSGASTGSAEALELRDGDLSRYRGLGCRKAATNISEDIHQAVAGQHYSGQTDFDEYLRSLDGTENKSALGANAMLAASIAFARATAAAHSRPLYRHFAEMAGLELKTLPQLTVNLFSGGKHAGGQVAIQDVLLVPTAAVSADESLSMVYAVYQAAAELILQKYGMRILRADEGGLAPPFRNVEDMLADGVQAIRNAGYRPGTDISLAIDVASTHFFHDGVYSIGEQRLSGVQMIDTLERWANEFPVVSIEDGLAEEDWSHWTLLHERLGDRIMILGDDLLCTNCDRIARAVSSQAANALLLKVNQIGTLTEACHSLRLAREAGWKVTVSARSGETEDNWLADLAVGWNGNQIKVGSITQSERLSKYNRLLAIEQETGLPIAAL
ncbi:MAG: phosphopyruvate hydratase [Planctomyces sp.]